VKKTFSHQIIAVHRKSLHLTAMSELRPEAGR